MTTNEIDNSIKYYESQIGLRQLFDDDDPREIIAELEALKALPKRADVEKLINKICKAIETYDNKTHPDDIRKYCDGIRTGYLRINYALKILMGDTIDGVNTIDDVDLDI